MGQDEPSPEPLALEGEQAPGAEPDPALVDAVREALGALNKAIRFRRMYPTTHEFYQRVLVELRERLDQALELTNEVHLDIGPQSFLLGKVTVFSDERGQQNLPFRFYKDGVQ